VPEVLQGGSFLDHHSMNDAVQSVHEWVACDEAQTREKQEKQDSLAGLISSRKLFDRSKLGA
jgi:hypothetical protein